MMTPGWCSTGLSILPWTSVVWRMLSGRPFRSTGPGEGSLRKERVVGNYGSRISGMIEGSLISI